MAQVFLFPPRTQLWLRSFPKPHRLPNPFSHTDHQQLPSGEVRSPLGFADDEDAEAPDIEELNEKALAATEALWYS